MMGSKFWNELAAKVKTASAAPAPRAVSVPVPNQIPLHEARLAGFFKLAKPMGWGLYRAEDIDGGLGSIWSIEKDATGNQFLVKQVDPAGEVLRKTASAVKVAAELIRQENTNSDGSGRNIRYYRCGCGAEVRCDQFTNTCDRCGAEYNSSGQRLAPHEQWGEETGESYSDIVTNPDRELEGARRDAIRRLAEGNDYIKENFNVGKDSKYQSDSEAQKARNTRAKELRSQGYTVEVGKSGFSDLARASSFWLKAYKGDKPAFSSLHIVQRVAVAPPGEEKLVKKLKKEPGVENPFAVAWSIHNKKKASGYVPKVNPSHEDSLDEAAHAYFGKPYAALPDDGPEQDMIAQMVSRSKGSMAQSGDMPDYKDKIASGLPGDEEPVELSEMAQLIQEIAFDQVHSGIVEDQGDVEREVAAWFESSYGAAPDMNAIREEIKKNYPIGQEKALKGGGHNPDNCQDPQCSKCAEIDPHMTEDGIGPKPKLGHVAAMDGCPKCGGQLTDMGGVYMCQACEDKNKAPAGAPGEPKKIAQLRKIVNESQNAKVDGVRVDLFSASAVVQVYDALGPEAKAKYVSMPIAQMVDIAFKLINQQKTAGANEPCAWCKRNVFTDHVVVYENGGKETRYLCTKCCDKAKKNEAFEGRAKTAAADWEDKWKAFFDEWKTLPDDIRSKAERKCIDDRIAELPEGSDFGSSDKWHTIYGAFSYNHVPGKLLEEVTEWLSWNRVASIDPSTEMTCEKCGVQTGGTKLCLKCSPESTMFKKPEGASMHGPMDSSASRRAAAGGGLDAMTESYLQTALWAETDNSTESGGEPLDANYSISDIAPESLAKAQADCMAFQEKAGALLDGIPREGRDVKDIIGHDFWLTRNGHGAGFWDGDYPKEIGEALTKLSKEFGECYIEVGDDGKIYLR